MERKPGKREPLLNTVAQTIGSTLGVIAAKADAVQKAVIPARKSARARAPKAASKRSGAGLKGRAKSRTSGKSRRRQGSPRRAKS